MSGTTTSRASTRSHRGPFWGGLSFKELSTAAVLVVFIVVGVSGLMLLLGLGVRSLRVVHEWLGLGFVLVAGVHLVRHRRGVLRLFGRAPVWMLAAVVACLVLALSLLAGGGRGWGRGSVQPEAGLLDGLLVSAPLVEIAPLLDTTPQTLVARLESAGMRVEDTGETPEVIATRAGRHPREALGALIGTGADTRKTGPALGSEHRTRTGSGPRRGQGRGRRAP